MPDIYDYWNASRIVSDITIHNWRDNENTQHERTKHTSREYLLKIASRHAEANFINLLTEAVSYLEYHINNNIYPELPNLKFNFARKVVAESYSDNDVLYFHPIQAARRAIAVLVDMDAFRLDHDDSNVYKFALSLVVYWAEASSSETYVPTYTSGAILAHTFTSEQLVAKRLEFFERFIRAGNGTYLQHCEYGNILMKSGAQFYQEALSEFKRALNLNKHCAQAYNGLGMVYTELSEPELALNNFQREHIELKRQAYVRALYEGQRGNNFNSAHTDTFTQENFLPDKTPCSNGRLNKQAECMSIYEQAYNDAHGKNATQLRTDFVDDIPPVIETQVCLSYQRQHMRNNTVITGAPTLSQYCDNLQACYVQLQANNLTQVDPVLEVELRLMFDNINTIFHGVSSANNPAGLLENREIRFIDETFAVSLESLPMINHCGELGAALNQQQKLVAFNAVLTREASFAPSIAAMPVEQRNAINAYMVVKMIELCCAIPRLHLTDSVAFRHNLLGLRYKTQQSSADHNNLPTVTARRGLDTEYNRILERFSTLRELNVPASAPSRPMGGLNARSTNNLPPARAATVPNALSDTRQSYVNRAFFSNSAVANTSNSAAGLVIDNRTSVVGFAMDNRTSLVGFAIDNRTSLVGFAIDNRTSLIGTLTINPARSESAEANNASPAPARRRRQNRAGS